MNRRKFTIALGTATAGLVAGSALFGQDATTTKKKKAAKSNSMFASRESFSYTEEEIAEYEREEGEALKNKRPKGRINLGDPHG